MANRKENFYYNDTWIRENYRKFRNLKEVCSKHNLIFGTSIPSKIFTNHCNRKLKIKITEKYTSKQDQWITENYPILGPCKSFKKFNEVFGMDYSIWSIRARARKLGICLSTEQRQYNIKHNIGNTLPKGTIRSKSGKHNDICIKTENGWERIKDIKFRRKDNEVIIHLDGDHKNCDAKNLMLLKRTEHSRMTGCKFWSSNPDIRKTGAIWAKLKTVVEKEFSNVT